MQEYNHVVSSPKYDDAIFNSDDIQFFAMWTSLGNRVDKPHVNLDIFSYWYDHKDRRAKVPSKQRTLYIPFALTSALSDFLHREPTDETFILPWGRSEFHLSFEKRGLFGQVELRWKLLYRKEARDKTLFLPNKERKEAQKDMKNEETRYSFWFDRNYSKKLALYLDFIL